MWRRVIGLGALVVMWLVALAAPLYLYALPFIHRGWFTLDRVPLWRLPYFGWSDDWPRASSSALTLGLALAGSILPAVWHRRSVARFRCPMVVVADPARPGLYRDAPGTLVQPSQPALVVRAAVLRYAGRLALSLAMVLPIYFLAFGASLIIQSCGAVMGCTMRIPGPREYVPLLAVMTIATVLQLPTWSRVFGPFDGLWGRARGSPVRGRAR